MVSTAEELKAEDELLNETPAETTAGDAPKADENTAPATAPPAAATTTTTTANGKANGKGKKGKKDEPDPMEETHVTEFDVEEHSKTLLEQMQKFREEKTLNDGHLVFASEGKMFSFLRVVWRATFGLKVLALRRVSNEQSH